MSGFITDGYSFFLLLTRTRGILVIAVLIVQKLLSDITS